MRVVLLLEGEHGGVEPIRDALARRGHEVANVRAAAARDLTTQPFSTADLIIADSDIAEHVSLVRELATASPGVEFVLVGGNTGNALAADVIAVLDRPLNVDTLLRYVDEVADILDGERLREPTVLVAYETLFAGESPEITSLLRRVRLVARSEAPVWIYGEDGSGRTIIARAIHDRSSRRNGPFIALNTAAYSDESLTTLLFEGDQAAVQQARMGSIFLEQIASSGPALQRALVQFLDKKRSEDKDSISPRLIVGVPLADPAVGAQHLFSTDLYFRLKVLEVEIPRLRDRARDLEHIVGRMLARLAVDRDPPAVATETIKLLERYAFPGNLLELAHALTHAYVVAHGNRIEPHHLPASMRRGFEPSASEGDLQSLETVAKQFERDYLLRVLRSVAGSRQRAADILGISRKGLWAKLKSHGITDDDIDESDANVS